MLQRPLREKQRGHQSLVMLRLRSAAKTHGDARRLGDDMCSCRRRVRRRWQESRTLLHCRLEALARTLRHTAEDCGTPLFPPRPRKPQWHCDVTNVISPHGQTYCNISHDTTNHPAHQRHAAFTPACFTLPSGTARHKRTFHQGRANPNGAATSRTSCRHTVRHPLEANIAHDTTNHPAHQRHAAFTPAWHGATQVHFPPRPRKSQWHCDITNVTSPQGLPIH